MKKSTLSILAALALGGLSPITAQSTVPDAATYFQFLSVNDRQTLGQKGELSASGNQFSQLPWGPKAPFAAQVASELTVPGATVAEEGLYLFAKPSGDALLKVYNALNDITSMAGLKYYSLSQKKMDTLILASWRVESVEKPTKLVDPTFPSLPPYQRAVVFQKDNRMGDGYSEVVFQTSAAGLSLTLRNLTGLKYGFLPLVDAGNLQMTFIVVPLADKLAVYAVMEVKTASLFGLEHSKDENFRNRLRALAGWLGQRIASVQ